MWWKDVVYFYFTELTPDITKTHGDECLRTESGEHYRGHLNYTMSRIPCQRWIDMSPHLHAYDDITFFADYAENRDAAIHDVVNYCRNPSALSVSDARPWCFTSNERIRKEYCDIPRCKRKCIIYDTLWKFYHVCSGYDHLSPSYSVFDDDALRYCYILWPRSHDLLTLDSGHAWRVTWSASPRSLRLFLLKNYLLNYLIIHLPIAVRVCH